MCQGAWAERTWSPPARAPLRCGADATVGPTRPQRLTKPRGSRPAREGGPSRLPRSGRRGRQLGRMRKQIYDPFGSPPVRCVAITLPLAIGAVNAHALQIGHPRPAGRPETPEPELWDNCVFGGTSVQPDFKDRLRFRRILIAGFLRFVDFKIYYLKFMILF